MVQPSDRMIFLNYTCEQVSIWVKKSIGFIPPLSIPIILEEKSKCLSLVDTKYFIISFCLLP